MAWCSDLMANTFLTRRLQLILMNITVRILELTMRRAIYSALILSNSGKHVSIIPSLPNGRRRSVCNVQWWVCTDETSLYGPTGRCLILSLVRSVALISYRDSRLDSSHQHVRWDLTLLLDFNFIQHEKDHLLYNNMSCRIESCVYFLHEKFPGNQYRP